MNHLHHRDDVPDDELCTEHDAPQQASASLEALSEQVRQLQQALHEERTARQREQEALLARLDAALDDRPARRLPPVALAENAAATSGAPDGTDEAADREAASTAEHGKTSRRGLLKWGGAAAAAATTALVASEQHSAHAARELNGDALYLGATNLFGNPIVNAASTTTTVSAISGTSPSPLFTVDNSNSQYTDIFGGGPTAISGITPSGTAGGIGVSGTSAYGAGVYGSSVHGTGVYGNNSYGAAIEGYSAFSVDLYAGGSGRLQLKQQSTPGAPTSTTTTYTSGEMIRDQFGELWLCIGTGAPATWVKVAHLSPGATSGGAITYMSKPVRLLDTRSNATDAYFHGGGPLTNQQPSPSYTLVVGNVSYNGVTVPMFPVGAIGNLTVVASSGGPGYVSLVPHGAGFSGTSNINYSANQTIANSFIVGLGSAGFLGLSVELDIYVGGAPTDVIIDLFAVVS